MECCGKSDLMQDKELLYKLAIGILCLTGVVGLTCWPQLAMLTRRRFDLLIALLWGVSRIGLFLVVFFAFRMDVTSDLDLYYYPQGRSALLGQMVHRDFVALSLGTAVLFHPRGKLTRARQSLRDPSNTR
jgi:hypothetical protein